MKKLIISCSVLMSLSLAGCNTMNDGMNSASQYSNHTVGRGVHYVATTGATVGRTVGTGVTTVLGGGMGLVTGKTVSTKYVTHYNKNGMMYRNGHAYRLQNGQYVLVR